MNHRMHAMKIVARWRIHETFISPGFYISLSFSLLLGFFLISGFMEAISSSGFDPTLNPLYDVISKVISGAFGETFSLKLFSGGPFFFILCLAFFPILVYLAFTSLYKFGMEINIGAIELITYGPVDGTSCVLASVIKNILVTGCYLIVLVIFFSIGALINNLVLGPTFFFAAVLIFFVSIGVYCYVALIMVITENANSGIALFLITFVFFSILQIGSFSMISGYVKSLSNTFGSFVQWFSPLYYWNNGLTLMEYGQISGYFMNIIFLLLLSSILLYVSHFIIRFKGVRA